MADDDKDFSFGDVGDDFTSDDGWGSLEEDAGGAGEPGGDFDLDAIEQGPAPVTPDGPGDTASEVKQPAAAVDEPTPENVRRSSSRMVLYGVLVVILSAAGFYYFTTSPSPPAAAKRPAPAKQTLAMPERPDSSAASGTSAADPAQMNNKAAVEVEIPRGTLREILPTEVAPAAPPVVDTPAAVPEEPVVSAPAPAVAENLPPPVASVAKKTKTSSAKPMAVGKYSIQAGAFVDHVNRDETLAKIRQLGFAGREEQVKKVMPMTRLLIGVYTEDAAKEKASELVKTIPTVFYLRRGNQMAVYAGSFYEIDKARVFADGLHQQGVKVEEEKAEVELTLSRLKFGSFPDLATAEKTAKKARDLGLEAEVIRNP